MTSPSPLPEHHTWTHNPLVQQLREELAIANHNLRAEFLLNQTLMDHLKELRLAAHQFISTVQGDMLSRRSPWGVWDADLLRELEAAVNKYTILDATVSAALKPEGSST